MQIKKYTNGLGDKVMRKKNKIEERVLVMNIMMMDKINIK
jgi:hypothetical protein